METIINNPWYAGIVVLITQIIFIYFRTLNVVYVAEKNILASIITGNAIGITWLISIAIGANSILNLEWQPLTAHIIGGTIGTYWGLIKK